MRGKRGDDRQSGTEPRMIDWHEFPSPQALAKALAEDVANALAAAISSRGTGFLALSGGETPARFLRALSGKELDWDRVAITLVDERFVPETSERSNARLVRHNLLQRDVARTRFVPLHHDEETVERAASIAARDLAALPWPLDVAVLGMGMDGHTASFFPDAENLAGLLDPAGTGLVLPVHAPSAAEPRLTLPLPRLVEAGLLPLHIEGEEKRAVLEEALRPGADKPISAIFAHARQAVPVYWTR